MTFGRDNFPQSIHLETIREKRKGSKILIDHSDLRSKALKYANRFREDPANSALSHGRPAVPQVPRRNNQRRAPNVNFNDSPNQARINSLAVPRPVERPDGNTTRRCRRLYFFDVTYFGALWISPGRGRLVAGIRGRRRKWNRTGIVRRTSSNVRDERGRGGGDRSECLNYLDLTGGAVALLVRLRNDACSSKSAVFVATPLASPSLPPPPPPPGRKNQCALTRWRNALDKNDIRRESVNMHRGGEKEHKARPLMSGRGVYYAALNCGLRQL